NEKVKQTLWQWQDIEANASKSMRSNFRYQMGLIRAYFDAHVQLRLIYETDLERQARTHLSSSKTLRTGKVIEL
ncbi:MAG: hypothetical protein KAQ79_15645, partial [Cyclobacteriaceae bacterium]|nr:hypothetical protein [Cyclobacteriaceae bacterium]